MYFHKIIWFPIILNNISDNILLIYLLIYINILLIYINIP